MKNFDNAIYEMVLDGCVYRGTRDELAAIIAEYRENHDQPLMGPNSYGSLGCIFLFTVSLIKFATLMNREEALATASKYGLQDEVAYAIDVLDCTPIEALEEWDIL